ncbi:hypothetical protein P879_08892 [Paragonimus westermani]|uniref:BPTI/Kunitz inhibitor domain-containing protein n=1 Tax=Paragonimus westermani TaxID=34504 RepID=A0A8T0DJ42_9TREM|nr:hypothetical protein P879_08892 [Paragonimus westermani]
MITVAPTKATARCTLTVNAGGCSDKITKYAFVMASRKCVTFLYSGCGGNGNRFDTLKDCTDLCTVKA